MGVFDIFRKNSKKEFQKDANATRQVQQHSNLFNDLVYDLIRNTPILSPDSLPDLVKYYQTNSLIYSLVDWKANKSSEIKPSLYKVVDDSNAKEYRKWNGKYTDAYELKKLKGLKNKAYQEIELSNISYNDLRFGKLKKLFTKPNPEMTWKLFVYAYIANKDICGFSAIWGNRIEGGNNNGQFEELYVLPSHQVNIIGGTPFQPIQGYKLNHKNYSKEFKAEDTMLINSFSFNYETNGSHLYGQSRVKAALAELDTFVYSKLRELYSYQTGDSATIIFPQDLEFANALSDKSATERQEWLDEIFKRLKQTNRQNVAVFPYPLDSRKIDSPLKDSNTTQAQMASKENICAIFHIPPPILGSQEASTYNNMKEARKMAISDAVLPEMRDLNECFSESIIPLYQTKGDKIEMQFDYDVFDELSQDVEQQANALSKMDFLSDNQKLAWFEYEVIKDERADLPQKYWETDLGFTANDNSYDDQPNK
jgi:Phage portal protein